MQEVKVNLGRRPSSMVGHCFAHNQEGVEVDDCHDEEGGVRPYGAGGFGSFQAFIFPTCLLHAEADLKLKKAFKEATPRTNAAGA
jgi:hypothetical protein